MKRKKDTETSNRQPESEALRLVERPRLIARLDELSQDQLVYVTAPAGYGKTTLLKQWSERNAAAAAYIAVEARDDSAAAFWTRTVQALDDAAGQEFAERAGEALAYFRIGQNESGIALLLDELERISGRPTLIWDNLHVLRSGSLLESIAFFAEHKPASLRVMAAGRGYPPFAAARLIARQRIALLGQGELRFTEKEGESFYFGRSGRQAEAISREDARDRTRSAEGWIAAMDRSDAELDRYLDEQIWAQADEDTQRFLLDASVLRSMNGRILRALGHGETGPLPEELFRSTELLIVPCGPEQGWFRLHGRFAGFLRRRLDRESPGRRRTLLRFAAEAFLREGRYSAALEHDLDGGHYAEAGRTLRLPAVDSGRGESVNAAWLSARLADIPVRHLRADPFLYFSLVYAVLLGERDRVRARHLLDEARRIGREPLQGEAGHEREARVEAVRQTIDALNALYAAVANRDFEPMLQFARSAGPFDDREKEQPAFARLALPAAFSLLWAYGREPANGAPAIGKNAMLPVLDELSALLGGHEIAAVIAAARAEALYEYDEAAEAARVAEQAYTGAVSGRRSAAFCAPAAGLALSRAYRALGERTQAKYALLRLRKDLPRLRLQEADCACAAELALLALDEEEPVLAHEWVRRFAGPPEASEPVSPAADFRRRFDLLRIRTALEDNAEARFLLDRLSEDAFVRGNVYLQVAIGVLDTILLEREGRREAAYDRLGGVLFEAEPHGFVRVFVDQGEPIRKLLSGLMASRKDNREEKRPSLAYARLLLARFGGVSDESEALALILTGQEIEVLTLIGGNRTNKEIAAELGIRYETVRTHIRNLYAKLKVGSREEALAEGRRLGLELLSVD
ncbi:LuxR C-terminal-related transcriptional regulator [Saccharibacillus sp. CPCC 101409]|uniref:LuxR C-terminal-related transcriptional regulator n=1 Tax=Saccharibacillus sp. CPCC 101409 TaxID=3058041 RepID=UPI0026735433|nr:LuxR C-terminal-related transcriptional regulator [Saccharibacillus sp. CPCC 101409]MDO3411280.1 LuxR C-terminal-related transcriptional regulator [Saccharibacillus sp. CPCC 101409]